MSSLFGCTHSADRGARASSLARPPVFNIFSEYPLPFFPGCGRKARCAAWLLPVKTFRKETRKCFWIRIWKSWSRISDTLGTDTAQRTACPRASGPTLFQGSFRFHLPDFFRKRNSDVDPAPCSQPAPLTGWLCRLLQAVRYVNHSMFCFLFS